PVRSHYQGFFRSYVEDPNLRGMMAFDITQQVGPSFAGAVTMIFPDKQLSFAITGMVDRSGVFRSTGRGPAGQMTLLGQFSDVGGGAALVAASYRFTSTGGNPDVGAATL